MARSHHSAEANDIPPTTSQMNRRASLLPSEESVYWTPPPGFFEDDIEQMVKGSMELGNDKTTAKIYALETQNAALIARGTVQSEFLIDLRDQNQDNENKIKALEKKAKENVIEVELKEESSAPSPTPAATGSTPVPSVYVRNETPATTMSGYSTTSRPKVQDPDKLTDGKTPRIDDWEHEIRHKLRRCAFDYPTEIDRIDYVVSRVAMPARDHLRARLHPRAPTHYRTAEEVIETLTAAYGKTDEVRQQEDHDNYDICYQKDRSFAEFWADYNRLAIATGVSATAQVLALRKRIHTDLSDAVVGMKFNTPQEFADHLLTVEPRIKDNQRRKERSQRIQSRKHNQEKGEHTTTAVKAIAMYM